MSFSKPRGIHKEPAVMIPVEPCSVSKKRFAVVECLCLLPPLLRNLSLVLA